MQARTLRRLVLFAVTFAVVVTGMRLLIVLRGDTVISAQYVAGLTISLCLAGFYGLVFGYLFHRSSGRRVPALLAWAGLALLVLIYAVSFHYEAVFGRLPGVQLLFYLDQVQELSPSLQSNLPAGVVAVETLAVIALLQAAWIRFGRLPPATRGSRLEWLSALPVAASIVISGAPGLVPEAMRWSSRDPIIWLAQSGFIKESYDLRTLKLAEADFDRFLRLHGRNDPGPLLDPAFPLCRPRPPPAHAATGQSVIVLILESVGYRELTGELRGRPLMPNLQRIAAQNVSFPHAVAPSTKSSQTLVALFSGLPPHPFEFYLWQTPLPNFDGLPRQLRDAGYDTAYLHGGDLAFERQRPYVRAVGFTEIREYDQRRRLPSYGWGYDDATMFDELKRWVERRGPDAPPYLVTLFTLSTHDPYILPGDWPPVFSSQTRQLRDPGKCCRIVGETDAAVAAAESFRFLDSQIGDFYAWYEKLADRPLLVIVGDHAPHIVNNYALDSGAGIRFDVALIIAGGPSRQAVGKLLEQPVSLHDVPVTLSELLGIRVHPCMVGRNLFDSRVAPPIVYAAGPESMEYVQFWDREGSYLYDRAGRRLSALQTADAAHAAQVLAPVRAFVETTFPVHYYLLMRNAYFPPPGVDRTRPALPTVTRPLFAAHRGNLDGPQPPEVENSRAALDRAAAGTTPWIEVDLQITADEIPVLLHDPVVEVDGNKVAVTDLTLDELRALPGRAGVLTLEEALAEYLPRKRMLIEAKAQPRFDVNSQFSRAIVEQLNRHPAERVIVDSFDEFIAASIKQQCRCEVGLDTRYRKALTDAELDHYHRLDMDWIYVEYSVVDAGLIRRAHARGLKVMAYTVNEQTPVDRWRRQGELPDGIISDYESIGRNW
jgi:phosphoglycerol transferase MdoB-like AlkP superfamily enzyme/glycerophosphoryl diester phosphodiesterase